MDSVDEMEQLRDQNDACEGGYNPLVDPLLNAASRAAPPAEEVYAGAVHQFELMVSSMHERLAQARGLALIMMRRVRMDRSRSPERETRLSDLCEMIEAAEQREATAKTLLAAYRSGQRSMLDTARELNRLNGSLARLSTDLRSI